MEFPALAKAHSEQLRPELIFRHALPFCIAEDAFFGLRPSSPRVLAALLAGHTLALTHLDYHLDGARPDPDAPATARKMAAATAVAYSIRMVYAAGRIADGLPRGNLFADVLDPVSGFVVLRMHEDWQERYTLDVLDNPAHHLRQYLGSRTSRLLGSGYWEVMVRGAFASHSVEPSRQLIAIVRSLRKLRQIVDEVADFREDVRAGLATTPLLFALADQSAGAETAGLLRSLWTRQANGAPLPETGLTELRNAVIAADGFDRSFRLADSAWMAWVSRCERLLGTRADGFVALLDLKRAKLAELANTQWQNPTTYSFFA